MEKRFSVRAVICIVILAVLVTSFATFATVAGLYSSKYYALLDRSDHLLTSRLDELDQIFRDYYIGEIDDDYLENFILKAYVYAAGDPYGDYMTAEEYSALSDEMQGNIYGIGVLADMEDVDAGCEILLVHAGSPAERAGLQEGDILIAADGVSFAGRTKEEVTGMVSGQLGTSVTLTVVRDGTNLEFSVLREKVTSTSVLYHLNCESDTIIGVIRILTFDATTTEQCKNALTYLKTRGARKFVFDLRSNSGGTLESVAGILDYLLPEGPILHIRGGEEEQVINSDENCFEADGYAVITNEMTASAAELFSCALRDYGLAVLVGSKTYGKGCMQTYVPLTDGGVLRVTYRLYDPPYSENYDGVGLTPDVPVEADETTKNTNIYKIEDSDDNQLTAAIAYLTETDQVA